MARGDLLKKLFLSYLKRNDDSFKSAALEIIAEEQKKNHTLLAEELQRILSNSVINSTTVEPRYDISTLPKDRERQALLVEIRKAERYLPDIILSKENQNRVEEIMNEFRRGEILRSHGINPRTKLLFCGLPGCGKTLLAEVMAAELGLPILYTRFDTIVSSYLGETSANLRKVFDYATRGTWVVFFDEFDAIGKSRDDLTEHGELKRVINSFLQLLDGFHGKSLVIAATNHEHLLDIALWRRFDEVLRLERPSIHDIRTLITKKLGGMPHPQIKPEAIACRLKGLSHAEVERICYDAIRLSVLRDLPEITSGLFKESLGREKQRLKIISKVDRRVKNSVK
jgi:SpoVK/Ycf46/Vps4 family AAA+-type ATPase